MLRCAAPSEPNEWSSSTLAHRMPKKWLTKNSYPTNITNVWWFMGAIMHGYAYFSKAPISETILYLLELWKRYTTRCGRTNDMWGSTPYRRASRTQIIRRGQASRPQSPPYFRRPEQRTTSVQCWTNNQIQPGYRKIMGELLVINLVLIDNDTLIGINNMD